jgi:hypothetical protein
VDSDITVVATTPAVVVMALAEILGVILIVILIVWLLRGGGYLSGF